MIIDGKEIAAGILKDLKQRVEELKKKGVTPNLYIILLSDDPSSGSYVKQKMLRGEEIGVKITLENADPQISTEKLIEKINRLNNNPSVHGIIVQRPMPKQLDEEKIEFSVIPQKDVDGFNPNSKFGVPVALAVMEILSKLKTENLKLKNLNFEGWLKTQKITVIGRGLTAGKPIINSFKKMGIEPFVISSQTQNPEEVLKNSDIVVSAVGKPNIINSSNVKKGTILIGVGMHREEDGKFHGDYDEEEIQNTASFYTPTPKGVGPVNVSMLLKNLVEASEK